MNAATVKHEFVPNFVVVFYLCIFSENEKKIWLKINSTNLGTDCNDPCSLK